MWAGSSHRAQSLDHSPLIAHWYPIPLFKCLLFPWWFILMDETHRWNVQTLESLLHKLRFLGSLQCFWFEQDHTGPAEVPVLSVQIPYSFSSARSNYRTLQRALFISVALNRVKIYFLLTLVLRKPESFCWNFPKKHLPWGRQHAWKKSSPNSWNLAKLKQTETHSSYGKCWVTSARQSSLLHLIETHRQNLQLCCLCASAWAYAPWTTSCVYEKYTPFSLHAAWLFATQRLLVRRITIPMSFWQLPPPAFFAWAERCSPGLVSLLLFFFFF